MTPDELMHLFVRATTHSFPIVLCALFHSTVSKENAFSVIWSQPLGLEEDLQEEAYQQETYTTFLYALQHQQPIVCTSQSLHLNHPRIRTLICIPVTLAHSSAHLILVATERDQENIEAADLAVLRLFADRLSDQSACLGPSELPPGQEDTIQRKNPPAQTKTCHRNSSVAPLLSAINAVTTHLYRVFTDSHRSMCPAARWALIALLILGLLLIAPIVRQQPPLPPFVPSARRDPPSIASSSQPNVPSSPTTKSGPHWLRIHAVKDVWLTVTIDHSLTKETFLQPDNTVEWMADHTFVVSTDTPAHIQLIFNGAPLWVPQHTGRERFHLRLPLVPPLVPK